MSVEISVLKNHHIHDKKNFGDKWVKWFKELGDEKDPYDTLFWKWHSWQNHEANTISCFFLVVPKSRQECSRNKMFLDREEFPEASKVLWGGGTFMVQNSWLGQTNSVPVSPGNKIFFIFFTLFVLNSWCFHEYMHCIMDTVTVPLYNLLCSSYS